MAGTEMSKEEIRERLFSEAEARAGRIRDMLLKDAEVKAEARFGDFWEGPVEAVKREKLRERLLFEAEIKAEAAFGDWLDQPGA